MFFNKFSNKKEDLDEKYNVAGNVWVTRIIAWKFTLKIKYNCVTLQQKILYYVFNVWSKNTENKISIIN